MANDKSSSVPYNRDIADQRRKYGDSVLRRCDEHLAAQRQYEEETQAKLEDARRKRPRDRAICVEEMKDGLSITSRSRSLVSPYMNDRSSGHRAGADAEDLESGATTNGTKMPTGSASRSSCISSTSAASWGSFASSLIHSSATIAQLNTASFWSCCAQPDRWRNGRTLSSVSIPLRQMTDCGAD